MSKPRKESRVLVVDDYENMRKRLCASLQRLGVHVAEATNGVEALERLRAEPFDIVFTDIVMPEMDGFELCEEIRDSAELNHLAIVVVSTHYDARYIIRALRLGADDYLPKPIEDSLVEQVYDRVTTPVSLGG